MKKRIKRFIMQTFLAATICAIIGEWWSMAEVNLYGFSQHSVVDALAAGAIAFGIAGLLMDEEG